MQILHVEEFLEMLKEDFLTKVLPDLKIYKNIYRTFPDYESHYQIIIGKWEALSLQQQKPRQMKTFGDSHKQQNIIKGQQTREGQKAPGKKPKPKPKPAAKVGGKNPKVTKLHNSLNVLKMGRKTMPMRGEKPISPSKPESPIIDKSKTLPAKKVGKEMRSWGISTKADPNIMQELDM